MSQKNSHEIEARKWKNDWLYIAYGAVFIPLNIWSLITQIQEGKSIVWAVVALIVVVLVTFGLGGWARKDRIEGAQWRDKSDAAFLRTVERLNKASERKGKK